MSPSGATILPQAVSPADAAKILATVNGAATAEALAAAIELPNEPDIGLALATRLLQRRAQLGTFTSLDQLRAVPGIGPVRFTRIVRAILGDVEGLIAPESVSEADTATVLAFLNGATTAQQLADGIELPNEPDVGLRLGAHLLERRAELGTFTSLDQLLTVPLIGPVRFTRIIRAILGKSTVPRDEFDALAAQVAALQAALATGAPRVVLDAIGPQRYLGQPLTIQATVTAPGGAPVVGVPVTLSASWGRLNGSDGFSVQTGGSVTLRTAADGTARVTLVAPTSEDLEAAQQAAVELVLNGLDPEAPTPQEASDELTALVEAYRFEANDDFRAGVDIYFRDFRQHLLDRVNYQDELAAWSTFDSTVVAYVHQLADDGTTDTGVVASGALLVHFRDWLGAWLQTHIDLADAGQPARRRPEPRDELLRAGRHALQDPPARGPVRLGAAGCRRSGRRPEGRRGEARRLPRDGRDRRAARGEQAGALPGGGHRERDGRHARGTGARSARADAPGGEVARRPADRDRPGVDRGVAGDRRAPVGGRHEDRRRRPARRSSPRRTTSTPS